MPPCPREAFISHSGEDRAFVRRLARCLRSCGIPAWYSEAHLVGGQLWYEEIGNALARCDWFFLVISPAAMSSKWVRRELAYALEVDRYTDRIVPILHKSCDFLAVSWGLAGYQRVDFTKGLRASQVLELVPVAIAPNERQARGWAGGPVPQTPWDFSHFGHR
ncbi:MAG: toll/interleukin-1 receptor domain-containing protein, partial [Planctomycetes bacterium]|nr:toll/interleukin-1 receptor domain-containing protein [Planctomycetota bacterium]